MKLRPVSTATGLPSTNCTVPPNISGVPSLIFLGVGTVAVTLV